MVNLNIWLWNRKVLPARKQRKLKKEIRKRILTMDKRRCLPKPRIRYKLKTVIVWRRKPNSFLRYYFTVWK